MSTPSSNFQLRKAYNHNFSKTNTYDTQQPYESTISNGHRLLSKEIWTQDSELSFCTTELQADNLATANPTILKKHTKVALEAIAGSNNQTYRVVIDNVWINRWIAPTDITNNIGETSSGFACKLYQNNDTQISLTEGVHIRNYFNGLIEFQEGYTPINLGYSLPLKVTFYEYVGEVLSDSINNNVANRDIVTARIDFSQHFNLKGDGSKISNDYLGTKMYLPITDRNGNVIYQ